LELIGLHLTDGNMPEFHDLTIKLNFPTKKKGNFSFFCLSGKSSVSNTAHKDSTQWESAYDRYQFVELSNILTSGMTHKYFIGKKTYLNSYVSYSGTEIGERRDSLDNLYELRPTFESSYIENATRFSINLNHKFNKKNTSRTGFIFSTVSFDLHSENVQTNEIFNDNKGTTYIARYYMAWKYRFSELFTLNTGVHSIFFGLNSTYSVEPRLSMQWNINSKQSVGIGSGIHSKLEPLLFYFAGVKGDDGNYSTPNTNLKFTKACHFVLSYENRLTDNLRLKMESYYQYLYEVPVENSVKSAYSVLNYGTGFGINIDNNADVPLVNKGSGRNYGIELTLEKFFSDNYYFLFTGSLFESKYKALDGIERNTRYNGNFITNCIAGKEFIIGKNKTNALIADIKFVWAGGNRLTPIDFEESELLGTTVYELDKRYTLKAVDYFKINFKLGYRKNKKNASYHVFLDVQNITNRKNVFLQYYDPGSGEIETFYQLGLLPILNFRIQF
jgi:hypothetical protein